MKNKREINGFTLVELLVAIVILGIITLMAIPQIANLISSNDSAIYETFQQTIETSGKLYTDSYKEDMFGHNQSGCYDISFDELKNKKLVQDINTRNVTCAGGTNKKTFVRVYKSGDHYKYKVSILCTSKTNENEIYYSNTIESSLEGDTTVCNGTTNDTAGPKISLSENGYTWSTGVGLTTTIIITDEYGLHENIEIKYAWTKTPDAVQESEWQHHNFYNNRYKDKVTLKLDVPQAQNEDYYLVIDPVAVIDVGMNLRTEMFKSNAFRFDNTKPECNIEVTGDIGDNEWYISKPTVKMTYTDERGEVETYGMSKSNETDDSKLDFNKNEEKTQGDTTGVTWYGYVKDGAGNISRCQTSTIKVDTTAPTKPTKGKISVSGAETSSYLPNADGSTDETSGVKEYLYLVKTTTGAPSKTNKAFTSSKAFNRSCATTYYAYAIAVDEAGNRSKVYSMGTASDGEDKYSLWTTCTKKCGTGTQTRTNTCSLVTTNLERNCNEHACCDASHIKYVDGSTCSKQCGGGTKNRLAYSTYDNTTRCSEFDESDGGAACNTQVCCDKDHVNYVDGDTCSKACGGGTKNRLAYSTYDSTVRCDSFDKKSGGAACNTQACCDKDHIKYVDGDTCSKACGGGTKNKVAYSTYDNTTRCSAFDETSGGSACNTQVCCDSSHIKYVDGSTCSKACGGGTKNRLAYSTYDNTTRCSDFDESSGGATCNTRACCDASHIKYVDGTTCSATCGTGTKNRLAYSTYDNTTRCSAFDQSSGGSTCDSGISCCTIKYYTSGETFCWNFAKKYMGGGQYYSNGKLELCIGEGTDCTVATEKECNKMGGTYLYFKYCP